ncbi:hypothetical protein F5Y15DRAFT_418318 [Xylariaceae sp. FL0016]|nr:hypothetical protein F5Y15DRAFT_418318 [Xylariaceae sp. FL0016]
MARSSNPCLDGGCYLVTDSQLWAFSVASFTLLVCCIIEICQPFEPRCSQCSQLIGTHPSSADAEAAKLSSGQHTRYRLRKRLVTLGSILINAGSRVYNSIQSIVQRMTVPAYETLMLGLADVLIGGAVATSAANIKPSMKPSDTFSAAAVFIYSALGSGASSLVPYARSEQPDAKSHREVKGKAHEKVREQVEERVQKQDERQVREQDQVAKLPALAAITCLLNFGIGLLRPPIYRLPILSLGSAILSTRLIFSPAAAPKQPVVDKKQELNEQTRDQAIHNFWQRAKNQVKRQFKKAGLDLLYGVYIASIVSVLPGDLPMSLFNIKTIGWIGLSKCLESIVYISTIEIHCAGKQGNKEVYIEVEGTEEQVIDQANEESKEEGKEQIAKAAKVIEEFAEDVKDITSEQGEEQVNEEAEELLLKQYAKVAEVIDKIAKDVEDITSEQEPRSDGAKAFVNPEDEGEEESPEWVRV